MKLDKPKLWTIMIGLAILSVTLWGSAWASAPMAASGRTAAANTGFAGAESGVKRITPGNAPVTEQIQADAVMPAGTTMRIRLDSTVSTKTSRAGDRFSATLVSPVDVDGTVILPVGTGVGGSIVSSAPSGRLKGRAVLTLRLNTISLSGRTYRLSTGSDTRVSGRHRNRNFAWIGGGAGGGLLIGALAGGPVGAVIGAGSGAAAGVAGAAITGRKQVNLPAETEMTFRLSRPLTVPEHPVRS